VLRDPVKAVIPAAGLGTRFLPYTKAQPKEMIPVLDKPAIQYVVEEAAGSGIREILIVTGRGKRAIEDHFDANVELEKHLAKGGKSVALKDLKALVAGLRIMYVRQAVPRGLGDAVLHAESFAQGESFAVLLGDDITLDPPCLRGLREVYRKHGGSVLAVQEVPRKDINRYGMVVGKEVEPGLFRVTDLVEKPTASEVRSNLAAIGRYILSPAVFGALRKTTSGKSGEIQLTDGIRRLLEKEDVFAAKYVGVRFDVGDLAGWFRATLAMGLKRKDLRRGVEDILSSR
jgi:UTP--glucose-1-phosphate uridylyltransferase